MFIFKLLCLNSKVYSLASLVVPLLLKPLLRCVLKGCLHIMLCYKIIKMRNLEWPTSQCNKASANHFKIWGNMIRILILLIWLVSTAGLAEPIRVFASVLPVKTLVEKIGGEHVDARVMVRLGFNPHSYDPPPQQISALTRAKLHVLASMPFEDAWMERIRSANPSMQVLDIWDGIGLRAMEAHAHDG